MQTGSPALERRYDRSISATRLVLDSIARPVKLLFASPVVLLLSLCGAIAFGYTYIIITTNTTVFEDRYHFPKATVGLAFLGLGTSILWMVLNLA